MTSSHSPSIAGEHRVGAGWAARTRGPPVPPRRRSRPTDSPMPNGVIENADEQCQPPANGGRTSTVDSHRPQWTARDGRHPVDQVRGQPSAPAPSARRTGRTARRPAPPGCRPAPAPRHGPAAARAAAKYRTIATSAADRRHRPARLQEGRVVDAVPRQLAPHRGPPALGDLARPSPPPRSSARRSVSSLAEQAVAHLTVGGQPGAVAVAGRTAGSRWRSPRPSAAPG